MTNLKNKKIGILVDGIGEYQYHFLEPIQKLFSELEVSMLTFVGYEINHPQEELRPANFVYDLATKHNLDGLIVFAMLSNFISDKEFQKFLERKKLPTVILGRTLEGFSSVAFDQSSGMHDLMNYLCDECEYKNFAFIRGWKDNFDSQLREAIFHDELLKRGLSTKESMRITGEFNEYTSETVTKELINSGQTIDVIVAANDAMAIGAMRALNQADIRVPEDIAVAGFDNIQVSTYTVPPLTTVRQPIQEIAEAAVKLLDETILTSTYNHVEFPCKLVKRRSTGKGYEPEYNESILSIPREIKHAFDKHLRSEIDVETLMAIWQHELKQWGLSNSDYNSCFNWINYLVSNPEINQLNQDASNSTHNFVKQAQEYVTNLIRYQNYTVATSARQNYIALMDIGHSMWAQTSIPTLMDYIKIKLSKTLIVQCYIALKSQYLHSVQQDQYIDIELVLSYKKNGLSHPVGVQLNSGLLLQKLFNDLDQDCQLIILPLFSAQCFYGYMFMEFVDFGNNSDEFEIMYSSFRRDIANAIHITLQRQEIMSYTSSLENLVDQRTIELKQEISEHKKTELELRVANTQLAEKAMQDGLTGLNNRYAFDQYLEKQWLEHEEQAKPISLILCDIDHFKLYNDSYGHLEGDNCLKEVADVLASQGNYPRDFVARYGGEEFAIILPNTEEQGACDIAVKVRNALNVKALPHKTSPTSEHVTVSMGICTLIPDTATALEFLILKADQALYQAKNQGRNSFHLNRSKDISGFAATYN